MNETGESRENREKRLGAAAAAAWWTLAVGAAWLTVGWLVWLLILRLRPTWVIALWGGGDLEWSTVQTVTLWFFGAFKVLLFAGFLIALWLTLWLRRLRRG